MKYPTKANTGARQCLAPDCARPATMASTNVNVDGTWYYCDEHMAAAIQRDRDNYRHTYQYRWPINGMANATPTQRAMFRDASRVLA